MRVVIARLLLRSEKRHLEMQIQDREFDLDLSLRLDRVTAALEAIGE